MQTAANINRFLTDCSSKLELADSEIVVSRGKFLLDIFVKHFAQPVHSQEILLTFTNELICFAEQVFNTRDLNALEEVSHVLMNLPIKAARQMGAYYYALAINRKGHTDEAKTLLETVADNAPMAYRARAIQTLGGIHHDLGQLDEALRFQLEVLRVVSDENAHGLQPTMMAGFEIATIKSLDGDHKGALSSLRSLRPLVNLVAKQKPFYFYLYCSELAIELGELGQVAEADAALSIALASPYASAYPNWAETRQELDAQRTSATPSVVAVSRVPQADPAPQTQPQSEPAPLRLTASGIPESNQVSFQISVFPIPATATSASSAMNILDRVLICAGSRAPPNHI